MSKATNDLKRHIQKMQRAVIQSRFGTNMLKALGDEAIRIIVRRTRLGYGVKQSLSDRQSLRSMRPHSRRYTEWRIRNANRLSEFTVPKKQNLTLTGQMLDSMKVIRIGQGGVTIGPTGRRTDVKLGNRRIAELQADAGRVFNNLSQLEYNQLFRFYRRLFGDLLKNERLTFKPDR